MLAAAQSRARPGQTGFRLLLDAHEAFFARLFMISRAQRTLDLQYYLFGGDMTSTLLTGSILRAADRGVHVRLLVDALSLVGRDYQAAVLNMHPNVEIRLFNPVAGHAGGFVARMIGMISSPRRLNRRMHNKLFVADRQFAVMGGRNVGDRYFGAGEDYVFRDVEVMAFGEVVNDISASFDTYWDSEIARTLKSLGVRNRSMAEFGRFRNRITTLRKRQRSVDYERELSRTALAASLSACDLNLTWADARLIVDPPGKITGAFPQGPSPFEQLAALAQAARKELLLVSPYFVPGERGMEILASLRSRGVRVVLVTNSLASTDVTAVHAGYRRYRQRLLDLGVQVHETKPTQAAASRLGKLLGVSRASLHAKVYVFDREHVVIGSLNLDPRSMFLNTEIGVLISSAAFAGEVASSVSLLSSSYYSYKVGTEGASRSVVWEDVDASVTHRILREPKANWWKRVFVWLLGWLPIEDLL